MYIGHSAPTSAAHKSPNGHHALGFLTQHVSAPAVIVLNRSTAAIQRVYCYAIASRAPSLHKRYGLLRTAKQHVLAELVPRATSYNYEIARVQQLKCTRKRTITSRALDQCQGSAWKASLYTLNCVRLARDNLNTSRSPQPLDDLSTSTHALTLMVLPDWHHLHGAVIAQSYELDTRTRCNVRSSTHLKIAPLYIKCLPQHFPLYSKNPQI